ncbi:MAG: hypothetical protein ACLUIR_04455 [Faecalibacterium prausnitzii]
MKTKRMKKLLMGMGLSRNQVNHMVKEQRLKGSSKISNAAYYTLSTAVFPSHAGAIGCRMSRALCWSEPHDE